MKKWILRVFGVVLGIAIFQVLKIMFFSWRLAIINKLELFWDKRDHQTVVFLF